MKDEFSQDREFIFEKKVHLLMIGTLLLFLMIIFFGCESKYFKDYPEDNFIEESIEDFIDDEYDFDFDISIFSEENDT